MSRSRKQLVQTTQSARPNIHVTALIFKQYTIMKKTVNFIFQSNDTVFFNFATDFTDYNI